jgi:hypothetical protein
MRQVQSAATGDEELAADGSLGIKDSDRSAACGRDLGCSQSGRPAADYGNVHGKVEGVKSVEMLKR